MYKFEFMGRYFEAKFYFKEVVIREEYGEWFKTKSFEHPAWQLFLKIKEGDEVVFDDCQLLIVDYYFLTHDKSLNKQLNKFMLEEKYSFTKEQYKEELNCCRESLIEYITKDEVIRDYLDD